MMPKEVLTDRSIRAEVLPGLSLRRICTLLERFQPDDFSADPLPRGQLPTVYLACPWQELVAEYVQDLALNGSACHVMSWHGIAIR